MVPERYRPITLRCACGHEMETDIAVARATVLPCNKCGKTEWKQLQARSAAKDKTAPLELIEQQEKERSKNE